MSRSFDQILQNINNFISLKKEDREKYATHFNTICQEILSRLSADPVFKKLYNGTNLAGSYADKLKISKPNEYDLVLHMKLIELQRVKITKNEKHGYININVADVLEKIKNEKQNKDIYEFLKNNSDSNGYLIQNKISNWMDQLIQKIKSEIQNKPISNYQLKFSKNGPAHTIDVYIGDKYFAIDFVPAFVFESNSWVAARKFPPHAQKTNWIAIAKPIPYKPVMNLGFRTSYVDTERELIKNKHNLKNTLKMLKKIRDNHNLNNLKSYYIKTVFLWEDEKRGAGYWRNSAGEVLMQMFEELVGYVNQGSIPFFWDKNENMLLHFSKKTQLEAIQRDLTSIFKKLQKAKDNNDEEKIYDIFLSKEEKSELLRRVPIERLMSNVSLGSSSTGSSRSRDSVDSEVLSMPNQISELYLSSNPIFKAKATTKAKQALNNIKCQLNSNDPLHAMNQISLIIKTYETEMQLEQTNGNGNCILQ